MTPPPPSCSAGRGPLLALLAVPVLLALAAGCASGDEAGSTPSEPTETTPIRASVATSSAGDPDDTEATADPATAGESPVGYRVEVVATHPHDPGAYTQGLEVVDGLLLESTGLRGESSIRLVDPTTGDPVTNIALDDDLYGEGATVVGDEVWQLTWTSEMVLVHGLDDLAERRRLSYEGEGWGLCARDDTLVMSNGTSVLTIRDPETFEVVERVEVVDEGEPLARLNELECVGDEVWANVFQTTRLVAIDPSTGRVTGSADLGELVPPGFEGDGTNVANGIAHDPDTGRFWLTGKRWPVLYEVELVPVS